MSEEFYIDEAGEIKGQIISSVFLGLNTHYTVKLEGIENTIELVQESSIDKIIPEGTNVSINIKKEKINIFSKDGSINLIKD